MILNGKARSIIKNILKFPKKLPVFWSFEITHFKVVQKKDEKTIIFIILVPGRNTR